MRWRFSLTFFRFCSSIFCSLLPSVSPFPVRPPPCSSGGSDVPKRDGLRGRVRRPGHPGAVSAQRDTWTMRGGMLRYEIHPCCSWAMPCARRLADSPTVTSRLVPFCVLVLSFLCMSVFHLIMTSAVPNAGAAAGVAGGQFALCYLHLTECSST